MKYEVEQKYRVQDLRHVEDRLRELGAEFTRAKNQVDRYFAHPSRDFARTDEAFRLRRDGAVNRITYKGPKIDATTKTRREIELPLPEGTAYFEELSELLQALGFRAVAEVAKRRTVTRVAWNDRKVEVSLDEVSELGCFVELEIVVEAEELSAAREAVVSLADEFQLAESIRRSYLAMLLEQRRESADG